MNNFSPKPTLIMAANTTHAGTSSAFRSFFENLPLPSSIRKSPLLAKSTRRGSEGRHGTPGTFLGKAGAYETGRFEDLVDDEEGVGLVDGRTSMEHDLKQDDTVLRRKSVFDEDDSNIKRVELRIGGMTVSSPEIRAINAGTPLIETYHTPSAALVSHPSNRC